VATLAPGIGLGGAAARKGKTAARKTIEVKERITLHCTARRPEAAEAVG
jgi:hypothetical protein